MKIINITKKYCVKVNFYRFIDSFFIFKQFNDRELFVLCFFFLLNILAQKTIIFLKFYLNSCLDAKFFMKRNFRKLELINEEHARS
jgi:hypothetical protein